MGKILFWLGLGAVAFAVIRFLSLVERKKAFRQAEELERTNRLEDIERCDRCGVYVPESEAVRANGRVYCSPEHRDQA